MQKLVNRKLSELNALPSQGSALQEVVDDLVSRWQSLPDVGSVNVEDTIRLLHETQRVEMVFACDQQDNADLWQEMNEKVGPAWTGDKQYQGVGEKDGEVLAGRLFEGIDLTPDDNLIINGFYFCAEVVDEIVRHCLEQDNDIEFGAEAKWQQMLMHHSSPEQLKGYADWLQQRLDWTQKLLAVRYNENEPEIFTKDERDAISAKWRGIGGGVASEMMKRRLDVNYEHYTPWSLTYLPTEHEATIDGMDYAEYKELFADAVDQPWPEINDAQLKLIGIFNNGTDIRVNNSDGTDISFSIDGHTFANSMIKRNVPGSEFFSAPVKNSVNGTIVAKGTFFEREFKTPITDMVLKVKDGRIYDWDAAVGKEALTKVIEKGDKEPKIDPKTGEPNPKFEGTRYFGEIGIGTNPHLQNHMANGLLVEKISGSFHMAIGNAYSNGYLGDSSVIMDNGNRAPKDFHWDVTTMLRPDKTNRDRSSEMWLTVDGKEHLVQRDGVWQEVPALGISAKDVDVLNRGWRAVKDMGKPVPERWLKKIAAEDLEASKAAKMAKE